MPKIGGAVSAFACLEAGISKVRKEIGKSGGKRSDGTGTRLVSAGAKRDKHKGDEAMSKPFKKKSLWKELWEYVKMILFVVIVVLVVDNFLLINAVIPSESMENTIMTGDRIFGNRLAYLFDDPERFDIVIFKYPDDESQRFIKRVIGLPGETVEIREGKVYINGSDTPLDDSFTPETPVGNFGPYTVPEGCYFMLGDNRNNSRDSRMWDNPYVKKEKILGKAVLRYFPGIEVLK